MKRLYFTFILLCLLLTPAYADSFDLVPKKFDYKYTFNDTRILLHYDNTALFRPVWLDGLPTPEDLTLKIFKKDKLVGKYFGVGFTEIYASQDNVYFLGISNLGIWEPAYIVFDSDGAVLAYQRHSSGKIKYYEKSVIALRQWTAHDNQDVKFEIVDGKLRGVSVMDTSHSCISLDLMPLDDFSGLQNYAGDTRPYIFVSIITALLLFVIGIAVQEVRKLLRLDTPRTCDFVAAFTRTTSRSLPLLVGLYYVINITIYALLSRGISYTWNPDYEPFYNCYILLFWGLTPSILGILLIFKRFSIPHKILGWILFILGTAGFALSFTPWLSELHTYLQ